MTNTAETVKCPTENKSQGNKKTFSVSARCLAMQSEKKKKF